MFCTFRTRLANRFSSSSVFPTKTTWHRGSRSISELLKNPKVAASFVAATPNPVIFKTRPRPGGVAGRLTGDAKTTEWLVSPSARTSSMTAQPDRTTEHKHPSIARTGEHREQAQAPANLRIL